MTEEGELRAGAPVRAAGFVLIPIERVRRLSYAGRVQLAHWSVEPVALVVCGEGRPKALDMDGSETPVEELELRAPGLREARPPAHSPSPPSFRRHRRRFGRHSCRR